MKSNGNLKFGIIFLVLIIQSYSLCAQTGPGGVGTSDGTSTLEYWISANIGITGVTPITAWNDQSGNGVSNTINGNPEFVNTVLNGQPIIRFDGAGDEILANLTINAVTYPDLTIMTVYIPRVGFSGSIWGEDNGNWDRYQTDINLLARLNAAVGAGYDPSNTSHPSNTIAGLFPIGTAVISTVNYQEDVINATSVRVDDTNVANFTSNADPYTGAFPTFSNLYIGAIGSNTFRFDGDIAELMVFSESLNLAQEIILEIIWRLNMGWLYQLQMCITKTILAMILK